MRKSLKRMLERLRAATNGMFGKPTAEDGGLERPQQMQVGEPAPARGTP
jgi:hypothetical protein